VVRSCGDFISILHRLSLRWAYPLLRQTIAILLVWALILGDMPDVLTGRVNSPGERQSKHDGLVSVGHDLFSHFGLTGALAASPVIYSISPNNVPAGQTVSISGANLGSSKGTVTVAGVSANITSWGANSISFQVPGAIPTGADQVVVSVVGGGSVSTTLSVVFAPVLSSISPTIGLPNAQVILTGSGFGTVQGGTVSFNGVAAQIQSWTNSQIIVTAPNGAAGRGPVVVNWQGVNSNGITYNYIPTISYLSQSTVSRNYGSFSVVGENFLPQTGTVTLNGVPISIYSWSNNSLSLPVPQNNCTGPIVVTTVYGASNPVTLTITGSTPGCMNSNKPPVANAGANQSVPLGSTVQLDGSGSTDPNGLSLTYQWSLITKPSGSTATLSSTTAVKPTFVADKAGSYTAQLIVSDQYSSSSPSTVVISTQIAPPTANAGPNQSVTNGANVQLNGSQSTDPNGLSLTYQWSFVSIPSGSAAQLSSAIAVNPTFVVDKVGNYVVQLVVNNGTLSSTASQVTVSDVYTPPTANAGPNQSVDVESVVQLNGSHSTDLQGYPLTYSWTLLSTPTGSVAIISNPTTVNPTLKPDLLGNYVAQLIVNDGVASSQPSTVTISTSDVPPVANPGVAQTVTVGTLVALDGTGSTDSDSQSLTYFWSVSTKPAGSNATLSSSTASKPTIQVDLPGTYVIQLIVNDGFLNSSAATVTISTNDVPPVANPGPNQTVAAGATVQLNGTASTDSVNRPLTYTWAILSQPSGGAATLSSTTVSQPTIVASAVGVYVVQLIVNDGYVNSQPATMTVTANQPNQPPTLSAGPNQTIELPTTLATLSGSASSTVPLGSPVTVQWTQVSGPGTVTFSTPTQPQTQATFPGVGTFVLQLSATVTATGLSNTAQTTITVAPVNKPPVVTVGPDQTITYPTTTASLSGSATDDGLPVGSSLVILWSKVVGPGTVTFANSAQPNTTATFSLPGNYVLQLSASDGQYTSSATMRVAFVAPASGGLSVSAGPDQVIVFPSAATLTGTATDANPYPGEVIAVGWSQVSGPGTATFANPTSLSTSVTFSTSGVYVLSLTATNGTFTATSDVKIYSGNIHCDLSNKGTDFWLMFTGAAFENPNPTPPQQLYLFISSDVATNGTVTIGQSSNLSFNQPFTVSPGQITTVTLSPAFQMISSDDVDANGIAMEAKGIHVTAENPVAVYGLNYYPAASDGYLGLPTLTLGTSYIVASYRNTIGSNDGQTFGTEFGIAATQDNTTVTIVPTAASGSREAEMPFTIQLNQGQTYQLRNSTNHTALSVPNGPPVDFTGTVVTSNKPVAVFGGHDCADIPDGSLYCNSLVEQMPATNLWGQNFVTMPLASEYNGDTFRFIAQTDSTQVQVNHQQVAVLQKGQFFEQIITGPAEISANNPILTVQYANSSVFGGNPNVDPSMIVVPPFEQFGGSYTVNTPTANFPVNFLNVIAPTVAVQAAGVLLDGNPIPATSFQPIGTSPFSGAQIQAAVGPHTLTAGLPFGVWVYGFNAQDAYGYTGGVCLANGVPGNTVVASPKSATAPITSQTTVQATVNDPFGQPIGGTGVTFTVTGINPQTFYATTNAAGLATFAYTSFKAGSDVITITVGTASDTAGVDWVSNGTNQPPIVNAGPNQAVSLPTNSVLLTGSVVDDGLPTGGTLTSKWTQLSGPAAVTFGTPNQPQTSATFSQAGTYVLQLTGNDSQLSTSATVTITVYPPNQPPAVNPGPDQTIVYPNQYITFNGTVTDDGLPVGSTLAIAWSQFSGPNLVTFTNQSAATTTVTFPSPGTYVLQLSASDGQFTTTKAVNAFVLGPPVVTTTPAVASGVVNTPIPLQGTITINGQPLTPGQINFGWNLFTAPTGVYYNASFSSTNSLSTQFQTDTPGTYKVGLCSGSTAYCGYTIINVVTTPQPLPTISIAAPLDGTQITAPTQVTGSVSGGNWVLDYALQNDFSPMVYTTLATGTGGVTNAQLATFDPTILLNGTYSLRLTSTNSAGQFASTSISVSVARNMKVGVFSLSFNDLTVPVSGIPIQIIRSYDSRDKGPGDFGIGWRLSLANIRVQKSRSLGPNWQETQNFGGFLPSYCLFATDNKIVTVTFPDGRVFTFQAGGTQQCQQVEQITTGTLTFVEQPGPANTAGATLTPADGGQFLVEGSSPGAVSIDGYDGNPYNPTTFILQTADGTKFTIDQQLGLTAVTDTNGNTLTITANGITSSAGKSVPFARDEQGRITRITDPNGNNLLYSYSSNGDLVGFTDRAANQNVYAYDGSHDLTGITTPDGKQVLTSSFDSSGRLTSTKDASGFTISFSNNVPGQTQTITDRNGNPTTYLYDTDGNITQVTDALNNVTTSTYDANDNKLSETNALGKTSNYTYDNNGNRLTETDPLHNTTTYTYNALNKPLTIQDANGHITTNSYDANGNLLTTTDALGKTTTNTYSSSGLLATTKDPLGNVTNFGYDRAGNLTSQTDATGTVTSYTYDGNGNRTSQSVTRTLPGGTQQTLNTSYTYDGNGRLLQTTYPDNSTSQTAYNTLGQQATTTDALGRQTSYQYNPDGHIIQTTYPDNTTEQSTYDDNGNRTRFIDRTSVFTTYTYDALNRVMQTQDISSRTLSTTAYDAIGEVLTSTDANGNATQYSYDDAGRRTTVTDALSHVTTFGYDAVGNQTSVKDANSNVTSYLYDATNRRTQVSYPDGKFETTTYDALGRVTARTDANFKITQYNYDALGRLIGVVQDAAPGGLNLLTQYGYDQVGNRLTQTDANAHTTSYNYDQRGRRTQRALPLGQSESYTYDAAGNLLTHTDFNSKTTTYSYDAANRLLSKTPDPSFNAPAVTYTYFTTGRRQTMTDASGTTNYVQYDNRGRLTQLSKPAGSLSYAYDLAGNLTRLSGSTNVNYTYDALNRLSTVSEINTGTSGYNYDNVGNLQSVTYPNGVAHNYSYDTRNRLTNLGVNASTTAIASYAYTLDAAGHRLSVSELSGRTVNYGYDNLYRLTGETIAGDPNGINGAVNYIYDPVGNRKQITSTLAPVPAGLWNYDANDRFTAGDTYDADGNTVSSGGIANVYDFENHLIQKAGVTIVYDGDGNRVSKTVAGVTTSFLVDTLNPTGYAQVVYESFNSSSFGNYELNHSYFYGLELISQTRSYVANFQSATQKIYYAYDGHGSVRALTSPTGSVTDTYDYDAFGNLIRSSTMLSTPTPNNYLFAGEQFDPDLNLYYNRARYLNTSTGRFWTADSADGDVQSPIYLHKYLYAAADPVDLIDPNGFTPLTDFIQKLASRGVDISARAYGSLAHNLIEADIFQKYFPNVLTEISVPGGEIDVVIFSGGNAHLYEIKPVGGTVPPNRQIQRYLAAGAGQFRLPLVAGTLTFSNTIRGPFVIDKITYETAGPGVITYEPAIDPPNGPLPIPVPIIVVLTALTVTLALVAVLIGSRGPTTAFI
jgi:RHS repeat-associated protein